MIEKIPKTQEESLDKIQLSLDLWPVFFASNNYEK